jgi:hypothetical protein
VFQVVLEILTGLPPYDGEREGHDLVSASCMCLNDDSTVAGCVAWSLTLTVLCRLVWQVTHVEAMCEETGSIEALLDQRAGDWGQSHVAASLYSVALNCIEDNKRKRPNMTTVLQRLEEIVGFIT